MEEEEWLSPLLQRELSLPPGKRFSAGESKEILSRFIRELIDHDFPRLVDLLYRIDVDEARLRAALRGKEGEETSGLIADLIIERQLEKIRSVKAFREGRDSASEEEKW